MKTTTIADTQRPSVPAREKFPSGAAMPESVFHKITLILEDPQSTFGEKIAGIEKEMLLDALERNTWVKIRAARELKATYRIFNYKCKQYGLERLRKGRKKKTDGVVLLDDNEF